MCPSELLLSNSILLLATIVAKHRRLFFVTKSQQMLIRPFIPLSTRVNAEICTDVHTHMLQPTLVFYIGSETGHYRANIYDMYSQFLLFS